MKNKIIAIKIHTATAKAISNELIQQLKGKSTRELLDIYINCANAVNGDKPIETGRIALLTEEIFSLIIENYKSKHLDNGQNNLDITNQECTQALKAVTYRIGNNISDPEYRHLSLEFISCLLRQRRNLFKDMFINNNQLLVDLIDQLNLILEHPDTINADRILVLICFGRLAKTVQDEFLFKGDHAQDARELLVDLGRGIQKFFSENVFQPYEYLFPVDGELISQYFIAVQKIAMKVLGNFRTDIKSEMVGVLNGNMTTIDLPFLNITPEGNGREVLFKVLKSFGFLADKNDFAFLINKIMAVDPGNRDHLESLLRSICHTWSDYKTSPDTNESEAKIINSFVHQQLDNILLKTSSLSTVDAVINNYLSVGDFDKVFAFIDLYIASNDEFQASKAASAARKLANKEYMNKSTVAYMGRLMTKYSYKVSVANKYWDMLISSSRNDLLEKGIDTSKTLSFIASNILNLYRAKCEEHQGEALKDKIEQYYSAFNNGMTVLSRVSDQRDFENMVDETKLLIEMYLAEHCDEIDDNKILEITQVLQSDERIMKRYTHMIIKKSREFGLERKVFARLLNSAILYPKENPIRKYIIKMLCKMNIKNIENILIQYIENKKYKELIFEMLSKMNKIEMLISHYEKKVQEGQLDGAKILEQLKDLKVSNQDILESNKAIETDVTDIKAMVLTINQKLNVVHRNMIKMSKMQLQHFHDASLGITSVMEQLLEYQELLQNSLENVNESSNHIADCIDFKVKLHVPGIDLSIDVKHIIKAIDEGYLKHKLVTPKQIWQHLVRKFVPGTAEA